MKDVLYIVDGHALIYRAYYAFIKNPLYTTKGENTQALFGFMRMILRLMNDEKPEYMVMVFDTKAKTFRHQLYPEYKAKRQKAPSDLLSQVETIKVLLDKLGLPRVEMDGFEADDVIGTLTDKAVNEGMKCIVVSGDKDFLQLVNDRIIVYANRKGISEIETMDVGKVEDVWGVKPDRIVELLSLMGDQSDNVPGVKGIGENHAMKLIRSFESLDNLYSNLDKVENERIRKLLSQGKESAYLSMELVTIRKNAPVEFAKEKFRIKDFPREEGVSLLMEKELKGIVSELKGNTIKGVTTVEERRAKKTAKYFLVSTMEDFEKLKEKIRERGRVSFDTESTGTDPISAEVIGVSISTDEGEGFYIPILSRDGPSFGIGIIKEGLKEILEDRSIEKVGQNIKYDYVILLKYGIFMRGIIGDSMIAAYLLNPEKQRYNLDDLAQEYLDYKTIHYDELVKSKEGTLLDSPIGDVVEYSCEDSDIALRLFNFLIKRLGEEKLIDLYKNIEIPLLVVLGKMESNGVRVDSEYLGRMSGKFGEEISALEKEIFDHAGVEFNVRSPKQLGEVLFERLKLPVIKKTKTGISTDESVLEELSHEHKIAKLLLRHRTLSKLKSTYIDSLPAMLNPKTGRVHTSFNQTITTTGRLSSSNPNLQNIPIREEEGRAIRRAFIPEDEWLFVSADYSQIELRVLASLSLDPALINTFKNDGDVHRETASILFSIPAGEVQDFQRQQAKTINFSIIYGMSPFGLSRRLGITRTEAALLIDMYFKKYTGVKDYFERVVEEAKRKGYVETLLNRRRYIRDINSDNRNMYEAARRVAINTPLQGTAADLIKKAMVDIDGELEKRGLKSRMLIQVHDELVFESPKGEIDSLMVIVKEKMENAMVFEVPLKVNVRVGYNWEEVH